MGAHGSIIVRTSVQPDLGKDSETSTSVEGDEEVLNVVLDEAFVARVKVAFEALDFTNVPFADFVASVVVELIKPEGAALVSIKAVERALTHLVDTKEITLPVFAPREMAGV